MKKRKIWFYERHVSLVLLTRSSPVFDAFSGACMCIHLSSKFSSFWHLRKLSDLRKQPLLFVCISHSRILYFPLRHTAYIWKKILMDINEHCFYIEISELLSRFITIFNHSIQMNTPDHKQPPAPPTKSREGIMTRLENRKKMPRPKLCYQIKRNFKVKEWEISGGIKNKKNIRSRKNQ